MDELHKTVNTSPGSKNNEKILIEQIKKMKQLVAFIIIIFCCKVISAQPLINSNADKKPATGANTYALIIGVAKYLDPEIPQLQFANRDAEIFADFLKSKAGGSVPKENIRLLTDSAATTAAVYNAVYWLTKNCKKDDIVYFYFSGHGDMENITMYNNGFLICYDSPPFNYVRLALSIDYLNDIANTLSAEKQANVIIITDACHSGKLTEKKFKGNFLAGEQLRNSRNKEIRITSSSSEQLSNENELWGNGRGVFSYYLINGLKGNADIKKDGTVTLDDIRTYLDSSMANDEVLKSENKIQTPAINGNGTFILSKTDDASLKKANEEIMQDKMLQRAVLVTSAVSEDNIEESAEEYFFNSLKKQSLEGLTDSLKLNDIPKEKITFALIAGIKDSITSKAGKEKLNELENSLKANNEILKQFNGRLAASFDEVGQRVITKYLQGDAAELERRQYYNVNSSGYDVYPRMFEVALKLTQPDNFYHNIIRVKLHYFSGVALRLKIPKTANPKDLIEKAMAEQKKALAIEKYAAYIYNEMGILYSYKKNAVEAEKYFIIAAKRAPSWAIPLSNLADLYANAGKLDKALLYADSAVKLQPGFQDIYVSYGLIYEKKANLLQAEEAFHKSIKLNSGHFLPFERLGYVCMNTGEFANADSMFYEAEERKKGFYFDGYNNPRFMKLPKDAPLSPVQCSIDSSSIGANDLMGHFTLGYQAYRDENLATAESEFKKVIALDNKHPLAFHYLGKTLSEQQRWQEAEIILKQSVENHLPFDLYMKYYDSLSKDNPDAASFICIDSCFRFGYYDKADDYLLLAELYENWNRFSESEIYYRKLIAADPQNANGFLSLASLFEKTGRYNDAENYLVEYNIRSNYQVDGELNKFYKRVTDRFPENADWNLKAGNFQYAMARSQPGGFTEDIKMTDPVTGELINKYPQHREAKFPDQFKYRLLPYGSIVSRRVVKVKFKPFTDGICYLRKALGLMQYDEAALAGVNTKIGDLYNWQGLPDSAIYFYDAAVKLNSADAGTRDKLIETYVLNYNYTNAMSQLDSLEGKGQLSFDNQLLLARLYMHDGRFTEAEKLLKAAERIHPGFNETITSLKGSMALLNKNPKQALQYYKSLSNFNSTDNSYLYDMARCNAKMENKPEAWKWLDLALAAGFNYTYVLKYDPWIENLRKDTKWKQKISTLNGKYYLSGN